MEKKKIYIWWVEKQTWVGEIPPKNAILTWIKTEEGDWVTGNYEYYELVEGDEK